MATFAFDWFILHYAPKFRSGNIWRASDQDSPCLVNRANGRYLFGRKLYAEKAALRRSRLFFGWKFMLQFHPTEETCFVSREPPICRSEWHRVFEAFAVVDDTHFANRLQKQWPAFGHRVWSTFFIQQPTWRLFLRKLKVGYFVLRNLSICRWWCDQIRGILVGAKIKRTFWRRNDRWHAALGSFLYPHVLRDITETYLKNSKQEYVYIDDEPGPLPEALSNETQHGTMESARQFPSHHNRLPLHEDYLPVLPGRFSTAGRRGFRWSL